jgi:transcriptional regulator with XRE-family HTH domain
MNWIRANRTAHSLTQTELASLVNFELLSIGSQHKITQARLSNLERLNRLELLACLYVIEYKQMKKIFSALEKVVECGVDKIPIKAPH